MKVLLLTHDLYGKGGIGNYFNILHGKFTYHVDYHITGSRLNEKGFFKNVFRFFNDYIQFLKIYKNYDLIHLNTSLRIKSFCRDLVFLWFSKLANRKIVVFIHGWNHDFSSFVEKYILWFYKFIYFKADSFIVLSSEFKEILIKWGYTKPISILSTLVDDEVLDSFLEKDVYRRIEREQTNILFLARIEREKGIYETIDVFQKLSAKVANLNCSIAGDGKEFNNVVQYIKDRNIQNIKILGFVTGDQKNNLYKEADLYLLPTNYGEGMPTSLLEAMSFGLPIITCAKGGINDFFEPEKMGFIINNNDQLLLCEKLETLVTNPQLRLQLGLYNYRYVRQHFPASRVMKKIEAVYESTINA